MEDPPMATSNENNRLEDVAWLASLSEAEIDWLISLKELAIVRARHAGRKDLADRFDIRVLRALGCCLLDFFNDRVAQASEFPNLDELLEWLSRSKLDGFVQKNGAPSKYTEDMKTLTSASMRKRMWEG